MAYGTLTPSGAAFQPLRASCCLASAGVPAPAPPARNPTCATPGSLARRWFRRIPFRSPLLRDLFCFLGVHEMFQFPHLPPTVRWVRAHDGPGVAPFGDAGIKA